MRLGEKEDKVSQCLRDKVETKRDEREIGDSERCSSAKAIMKEIYMGSIILPVDLSIAHHHPHLYYSMPGNQTIQLLRDAKFRIQAQLEDQYVSGRVRGALTEEILGSLKVGKDTGCAVAMFIGDCFCTTVKPLSYRLPGVYKEGAPRRN